MKRAWLLLPLLIAASRAPARPAVDYPALGRELVELVRTEFYDPEKAAAWAGEHADYAAGISEREAFARATRTALARLEASHTEYYTPDDVGYYGLLAIFEPGLERPPEYESAGLAARKLHDGWFVERVFPGGPAAAAGARRGDRLLFVEGEPFDPLLSWRGRDGREVTLEIERRPDERRQLKVVPRRVHPREEWLAAQRASTRIIEHQDRRIAVTALWSCAGLEHQEALAEAIAGELAEADALVVDLRGGWGGCSATFLDLFNPYTPVLESIAPGGERTVWAPSWRKPLVVLIDEGSRSGKEMVARAIQRHGVGTLVGGRTAGAVLAGRPFVLSDGSLLYLAVRDVRVDGERLEGVGVEPDIEVGAELRWAAGEDPQMERALEVASGSRQL